MTAFSRNLLRVSVSALLCGAAMVLPATACGVLADWPAGAIYPATVPLASLERPEKKKMSQIQVQY